MTKNEEILDVIEEKDIGDYMSEYYTLRQKIIEMLGKLKNNGVECDCDDSEDYFTINCDNDEGQKICVDCGGFIEWDRGHY